METILGALTASLAIAISMVVGLFVLVARLSALIGALQATAPQRFVSHPAPIPDPQPAPEPVLSPAQPPPPTREEAIAAGEAMLQSMSDEELLGLQERERGPSTGTTSRNVCGAWDEQDEMEAALEELERAGVKVK